MNFRDHAIYIECTCSKSFVTTINIKVKIQWLQKYQLIENYKSVYIFGGLDYTGEQDQIELISKNDITC